MVPQSCRAIIYAEKLLLERSSVSMRQGDLTGGVMCILQYNSYSVHYKEAECLRQTLEPFLYNYGVDVVMHGLSPSVITSSSFSHRCDSCMSDVSNLKRTPPSEASHTLRKTF